MSLVQALQDARISHLDLSGSISILGDVRVGDVLSQMRVQRASAALIEDDNGLLIGIFTERDVLLKIADEPAHLQDMVRQHMTVNPHTVKPEDTAGHALHLMNAGHYRHVPVLDADGRSVGNLDQHAVIRFLTDHFPREVYNLPPDPERIPRTREGA
jgi:CBS domain-containing protein